MHRVEPHEVFDRHSTETGAHDVLATGDPSTTFLVEPGERPFQADARLRLKASVSNQPLEHFSLVLSTRPWYFSRVGGADGRGLFNGSTDPRAEGF